MRDLKTVEVDGAIRRVTDEEVAFYEQNGWVKLDNLIAPELASEFGRAGKELLERSSPDDSSPRTQPALRGIEPFRSLVFSNAMGDNAKRLVNRKRITDRQIPLRYRTDFVFTKAPGGQRTRYHQDSAEHGSDRIGELQFWLALVHVTPEMGAMRFLSGVHREGPLGSCFQKDTADT